MNEEKKENQTCQAPSREKLAALQARARQSREGGGARAGAGNRSKRPGPLRIAIWCLEAVVLFSAVVYFFLLPALSSSESQSGKPAPDKPRHRGQPVPVLGSQALEMPGLREVSTAMLSPLEDLPTGGAIAQKTQRLVAEEEKLPVEVKNSLGISFRLVPQGSFLMGSPAGEAGRWEGEVQHVATVPRPFYMSKYEITQHQWRRLMKRNPSHFRGAQRPVEEVSWHDIRAFIRKLCDREGLERGVYRLPREKEWEYACRAGTETAFYFGNDVAWLKHFAIFLGSSQGQTEAVGAKRPNAFGLYNMHGNVWEWCLNQFRHYPDFAGKNPYRDWRVVRGGHWRGEALRCRSANRSHLPPASHGNMLGFRLVREIVAFEGEPLKELP